MKKEIVDLKIDGANVSYTLKQGGKEKRVTQHATSLKGFIEEGLAFNIEFVSTDKRIVELVKLIKELREKNNKVNTFIEEQLMDF